MLASSIPSKFNIPFANSAGVSYIRTIPEASQIGITPGAASLTDGFPPLNFLPVSSGGVPPFGQDFNGLLNHITKVQQWQNAGGIFKYDSAFSTAIGGYPAGATLMGSDNKTVWINLSDNNTTDPESSPVGWGLLSSYGITAITGLTNTNVTLSPAQYSKGIITLAGTLTGNVQIIFPTNTQRWIVINNTTGAFTVTCKTAAGTGAVVNKGVKHELFGDGTNLVTLGPVSSFGVNNYQIHPDGTIEQWGTASTSAGNATITWPIAFPNTVSSVLAITNNDNNATNATVAVFQIIATPTTSSGTFVARNPTDGSKLSGTIGFYWRAIGY